MITQILLTWLVCFGIYKATRYRYNLIENKESFEILGFIKKWGDRHLPTYIQKPVYNCPPCMGSFWSLVTSLYFGVSFELLLIIPAVSGLNYITVRMFPFSEE